MASLTCARHSGRQLNSEPERNGETDTAPQAGYKAAEICEAIANAAKTAGRLISLRNWSTESIAIVPQIKRFKKRPLNSPAERSDDRRSKTDR